MKSDSKPDVCIVGLGYIGLPTAAIVARAGCRVHGVDLSPQVVETINRGAIHIEEVDLDGLVHGVVARGLLKASAEVAPADVFIIAFANELSIVADRMGLDVWDVIRLANRHPRVNILQPGPGVGGHCIAVDPWFIVHGAPEHTPLIRTARGVNDGKIHHVIARAEALITAHPAARVACLGLAFKANIDDFRESPARLVAATLARKFGSRINVVEPYAAELPREFTGTGAELIDLDTALEQAGILLVLVDHDQFRAVPLAERAGKLVYDTRGIWLDQPAAPVAEPLRKAG